MISSRAQYLEDRNRADMRKLRGRAFVATVLQIMGKYIDDNRNMREAAYELEKLCQDNGVEILTDFIRQEMSLPPRGPDGWTNEEIMELEKRRFELMSRPFTVPSWPGSKSDTDAA